jgi:hypothetical protein
VLTTAPRLRMAVRLSMSEQMHQCVAVGLAGPGAELPRSCALSALIPAPDLVNQVASELGLWLITLVREGLPRPSFRPAIPRTRAGRGAARDRTGQSPVAPSVLSLSQKFPLPHAGLQSADRSSPGRDKAQSSEKGPISSKE